MSSQDSQRTQKKNIMQAKYDENVSETGSWFTSVTWFVAVPNNRDSFFAYESPYTFSHKKVNNDDDN